MHEPAVGDHTFIVGFAHVVGPGCDDVSHTLNYWPSSLAFEPGLRAWPSSLDFIIRVFLFRLSLLLAQGDVDESPHPSSNLLLCNRLGDISHTIPYSHVILIETGVAV